MNPRTNMSQNENDYFKKPSEKAPMDNPLPQESSGGVGDGPSSSYKLPGGLLTLLNVEGRAELPPVSTIGKPPFLVALVRDCPETYAQYIMHLRAGAYMHVAAEAIGIPQTTIQDWAKRGRRDLAANPPIDSYYSRFVLDVRKAVATVRIRAEQALYELDVKRWLTLGPGKIFGNEWSDPATKVNDPEQLEDNAFSSTPQLEQRDDGSSYTLTESDQEGVKEALRLSGMVNDSIEPPVEIEQDEDYADNDNLDS